MPLIHVVFSIAMCSDESDYVLFRKQHQVLCIADIQVFKFGIYVFVQKMEFSKQTTSYWSNYFFLIDYIWIKTAVANSVGKI